MGQGPSTPGGVGPARRDDLPVRATQDNPAGPQPVGWPSQLAPGSTQGSLQTGTAIPPAPPAHPLASAGGGPPHAAMTMPQLVQAAAALNQALMASTPSLAQPGASAAAAPAAAGPAGPPAATPATRPSHLYKHANLIPVFSKSLSSQALHLDGQRCQHPAGSQPRAVTPYDTYAVLDLEVMKFVAYCGGLTVKFRVDEVPSLPALMGLPHQVGWGIVSTKACPNLSVEQADAGSGTTPASSSTPAAAAAAAGASGKPGDTTKLVTCFPGGRCISQPQSPLPVDNPARKPFYVVAGTCTQAAPAQGDVLSMEFAPQEAGKPYIKATLSLNGTVLMQQCLPCQSISMVQLHPFVTLPPGMAATLFEAATPSPLFTWFAAGAGSAAPDVQLTDLDTCIKYASAPATGAQAASASALHLGPQVDFLGSNMFTAGRQRWTVQLDNGGALPAYVFVGVTSCTSGPHAAAAAAAAAAAGSVIVGAASSSSGPAGSAGPLRSTAGSSSASTSTAGAVPAACAAGPTSSSAVGAASGLPQQEAGPDASDAGPARSSLSGSARVSGSGDAARGPRASGSGTTNSQPASGPTQWGAWIRLPGPASVGPLHSSGVAPPRDGLAHYTEATNNHCYITVDLDLNAGFMRIFRNGHTIGTTFTGLAGTLCPVVAFVQGASISCQLSLVNITKLRQLDLEWAMERCSADLQLAGPVVSKVSEVYGDYSTVLANQGFTNGVHLWMIKINNLSEPDSIFIGVCRGCMPLDQDPQDLRDRTYYLSNGVIRVGGRRVATNAAQFTKGDMVTVVLDADQGEIVFFRNGLEQGRARGIRGRLFPFVSCDSEGDQVTLVSSYTLRLDRMARQLADMEWDTLGHAADVELSSNCLTATKTASSQPSTVQGSVVYQGSGVHEFHVILDTIGPDGVWVGVAPRHMDPNHTVGDAGCGWALHSDGDKRCGGREEEYSAPFRNGDVLTVVLDLSRGTLCFNRNGAPLGEAFTGVTGELVPAATLASEESKITIQNRPTVLNTGAYVGDLRWDEARAGKDLTVIDGLTVTKMGNDGGDYATVLGTLCLASGQHSWNVYINHVEDSNLFIGVTVGGHDLNADPQEMKHRTYYLSNGTIRVAGKLVTRCAEPYAEGDLVAVQLDMDNHHIQFLKNGIIQGAGDGLPEEVWPYISLDNVMDSITLHSSAMFMDLMQSLRWNPSKACRLVALAPDGSSAALRPMGGEDTYGQGTVLGLREYSKVETHTWLVRVEQPPSSAPIANFLVGVAPPTMDLNKSLGEEHCGIGLDYYGYFYVNGRYFHGSNLSNWKDVSKPVRGSTAKHKGKSHPVFTFEDGKCEVTLTLDLKECTLRFAHGGRNIGIITDVQGPLHAAVTLTSSRQKACLGPGPIGKSEHTNEELVSILKGKGVPLTAKMEAALLLVPRELFVPRDRQREAFRDQKVTVRTSDGSTMTLPPPSFVATALDRLGVGTTAKSFLDVGCGTGYVSALAACLMGNCVTTPAAGLSAGAAALPAIALQGIECVNSRLEAACANMRALKDRLAAGALPVACQALGDPAAALSRVELLLANVLIPECTNGTTYDALFCDVAVTEEELPMLLSLLNPSGRLVCLLEEEAVLITRGGGDAHDYQREVLQQLQGEYGTLEDPTPWEVQEAIRRIKERERKRGHDQAKQDVASLRNFEYVEMAQRVQVALQRIAELESLLQRAEQQQLLAAATAAQQAAAAAATSGLALRSPLGHELRSPGQAGSVADDVRVALKDKERRGVNSLLKASPRGSFSYGSPLASPGLHDSGDWKAMYTTEAGQVSPGPPSKSKRLQELLLEQDQSDGALFTGDDDGQGIPLAEDAAMGTGLVDDDDDDDDVLHVPLESNSPMVPLPFLLGPASQLHVAHQVYENIIDSMSVQTFTPEQISGMISGSEPVQVENRDVYHGTFKGVRVRVWRVHVSHGVSHLELKRAYNKYCIAHPNVAAVLGVCIQPCPAQPPNTTTPLSASHPGSQSCQDVKRCASAPAPSPLSKCTYARSVPDVSSLPPNKSQSLTAQREAAAEGSGMAVDEPEGGAAADARSIFEDSMEEDAVEPGSFGSGFGQPGSFLLGAGFRTPDKQHPGASPTPALPQQPQQHVLWVVEESFGDESLHTRLERGMLSWQQACRVATDMCKALAFLQDLKRHSEGVGEAATSLDLTSPGGPRGEDGTSPVPRFGSLASQQQASAMLSAYALRTIVTPANVQVNAQSTKVSVLPALLHHLEQVAGVPLHTPQQPLLHCDMAYIDPHSLLSGEASTPSLYAYGIVMLQLLTEQGPLGLLSAVKEALDSRTLMNLIPRLPSNASMATWAHDFAQLALRCTQPPASAGGPLAAAGGALAAAGAVSMSASLSINPGGGALVSLEAELLPALEELGRRLGQLGSTAMSWEQVEEMLMLPLQPRTSSEASARRWVRQDFRVRRKLFMEEVAKLAVDGPVHKIEVRRGRCFKDSIAVFAGKGHAVWRQPLKVTFLGEQGMDSGGVTREWFSALSSSISRGSPELFWPVGPQRNQLYINPVSSAPSHLKKFHFVGLFMAKAILESSARSKELGPITLNLPFCEPLWKLLLGIPLNLMDLQLLDPTEFRSLMTILDMDIDGLIFETFSWSFHQQQPAAAVRVSAAGFGVGPGYVAPGSQPAAPGGGPSLSAGTGAAAAAGSSSATAAAGSVTPRGGVTSSSSAPNLSPLSPPAALQVPDNEPSTPTAAGGAHGGNMFASPRVGSTVLLEHDSSQQGVSIPLKPGGTHLKVTNHNKREYVLLKAHKMLVGTIEAQMGAVIDAFHSLIPRDLVDKYAFTSMEMQLLVCGEQRIDIQDLQRNCKYEDGYTGKEPIIGWFWQVVEGFDDALRRQLLQFWSGSDGMPAEGFAAMDPAFHMVAVERLYDAADTTARLPAAHTCFRQLDLPRYRSAEELREKLTTAITIGQGYMALS